MRFEPVRNTRKGLMARLRRIQVRGFRSLRDVDLTDLSGPTVLIGPNGAGKSNLLGFLQMVEFLNSGSLGRFVGEAGGAAALLHYGPKRTREIEFTLDFEQEAQDDQAQPALNAYSARLAFAAGDRLVFLEEQVGFRRANVPQFRWYSFGAGHFESRLTEVEGTTGTAGTTARTTRWMLNRMNFFHFHDTSAAAAIRSNSRVEDCRYLRSDGSNLAAYLMALKESEEVDTRAAWQRITGLIRKVAPFIKELSPALVGTERRAVRLDWIDDRDEIFGPHQLSDGTLRVIALITALGQPGDRRPLFVTIDEPELGLHPAAVTLFCSLVRSVVPRTQVVLATQSPALLDHFVPEEVVVVERQDGSSLFRRLDPASLATWLEEYSLSELYDKNVLGGRP